MATVQQGQPPHRKSLVQWCLGWARPNYPTETSLTEEDWRSQHDEISKNIWNLAWLLVASCLFCVITLGVPDSVLVNPDAKVNIPFAGTQVSYTGFLFFGPLVPVVLALYLHVFVEQRLRIGRFKDHPLSPFLFNLGRPSAEILSAFVFYWMVPCLLIFFCQRALPRPEAPVLMFVTAAVTTLMVALGIRRYGARGRLTAVRRTVLAALWLVFVVCVVLVFPLGRTVGGILLHSQSSPASRMMLPTRRLDLFGALLEKTNLRRLYARNADMREANLRDADLEEADLSHADLREADLSRANLTRANLSGARLEGAKLTDALLRLCDLHGATIDNRTVADVKWLRVVCIVNQTRGGACPDPANWQWADLKDADLRDTNLSNADLTGVDLQGSDLRGASLDRAVLRLADLRDLNVDPQALKNAVTDGALGLPEAFPKKDAIVLLLNHATLSWLQVPASPDKGNPLSTSRDSSLIAKPGRQHEWYVRRFQSGYLEFMSLVHLKEGKRACLDGSFGTDNNTQVQLWECSPVKNDAYDNQQWRIRTSRLAEGYVHISKGNTQVCLDSGGSPYTNLHLWSCIEDSHNQGWNLKPINAQH